MNEAARQDIKQTLLANPAVAQVRIETVTRVTTTFKSGLSDAECDAARAQIYKAELELLQKYDEALIDFNLNSNRPDHR